MAQSRPRVAFVEDSDEDFALLRRVFSDFGTLHRWPDGEGALQALRDGEVSVEEIDALIVDLNLPGIDGFEVIERTRALPGGTRPMVCVLSSSDSEADKRRAEQAGADGYLVKPHDLAGLRRLPTKLVELAARRTG